MERAAIHSFLEGGPFAVVGASRSRRKYGNKCLRCYWQDGREAYAVNPNGTVVEGRTCYPSLSALPVVPHAVSIITQPEVSEEVVAEALSLGITNLWMQPGAESARAVALAREADANLIWGGPCLLVVLGYSESGR
jgi:predicted CoA-binding protein